MKMCSYVKIPSEVTDLKVIIDFVDLAVIALQFRGRPCITYAEPSRPDERIVPTCLLNAQY